MALNVLYRILNGDGELLYVGATVNPAQRFVTHSATQPWWGEAAQITVDHYETREALAEAEAAAIQSESPRYNKLGCKPALWARKPRNPQGEGTLFRRASDGMWIGRVPIPGSAGKVKYRQVSSRSRESAIRKLVAVRAELGVPSSATDDQ